MFKLPSGVKTTDKLNVNPQLIGKEVSLVPRWLQAVRSLTPPDDFEPSENQTTKKSKQVFTPPPRESQAGEYEVIVPTFPQACPGWGGVSNDWCIMKKFWI